jgi:hypothetical protein
MKGRKPSKETLIGVKNRVFSEEVINFLSERRKDRRIFTFKHKDGTIETNNVFDFREKHNLCRKYITELIYNKRKTFKGWYIIE